MANWIKVGNEFVNLDNVQHARLQPKQDASPAALGLWFVADGNSEYGLLFEGEEQAALEAWLMSEAVDVVPAYQKREKARAKEAGRRANADLELAIQRYCPTENGVDGHGWQLRRDQMGYDCVFCGLYAPNQESESLIASYGGVVHEYMAEQ